MAEKKSKVKAHRGFIHIPKRRGPRRPIRRNPVNLKNLGYFGRLPKGMQDLLLQGDPRRRPGFPGFPPPIRRVGDIPFSTLNANLKQLRESARGSGISIPRFPTGTPPPNIRRNPEKMKEFRRKQIMSQLRRTQNFINEFSRPQQLARMGSRRQTAAPVQQAVRNPNTRRRIPNRLRTRVRTMVAKGGTAKKKK